MKQFFKEVLWCFYPPRYKQICTKDVHSSLKFMSFVLLACFFVAAVFYLPELVSLRSSISEQFDNFVFFNVDANFSTAAPVKIPFKHPLIVFDSSSQNISNELFVFDGDSVKYRLFGRHSVPLSSFSYASPDKDAVGSFIFSLFVLFLPSVFIILFVKFWLKYFILVYLIGFILFILFDLTHWRLKFSQILSIAFHTSLVMIVLEVFSAPFGSGFLVPFIKFLGINVYVVSIVVFFVFTAAGMVFANLKSKND